MSPIRIGNPIRSQTEYTFEEAYGVVAERAADRELFTTVYLPDDEDVRELWDLFHIGRRQVVSVWTGQPITPDDERQLREILSTCKVAFDLNGMPVVKTELLGNYDTDEDTITILQRIMKDGLAEWLLRGRTRDVRACFWCGCLFRADRTNALFDHTRCRTAYHRAVNTATNSDNSPEGLLGWFRCAECHGKKLISAASGLMLDPFDESAFIGAARGEDRICRTCAADNHPAWSDYIVPTSVAA